MPAFRYFFVMSFVLPAYREVTRESARAINDAINKLQVHPKLNQSIFNQVTGLSKRGTIAKKLASLAKKGEITKEEALSSVRKIESAMPGLEALTDKSGDLIQRSLDKWGSMAKGAKATAVRKALEAAVQ